MHILDKWLHYLFIIKLGYNKVFFQVFLIQRSQK